ERSKMGKFVRWDVLDGRLSWNFDQDKIVAEKLFDGCYIVSGEVPKEKMAASEVVASYKKLRFSRGSVPQSQDRATRSTARLPQDRCPNQKSRVPLHACL